MLPLLKLSRYIVKTGPNKINNNPCAYDIIRASNCTYSIIHHTNKFIYTLDLIDSTLLVRIPRIYYHICYHLNKSRNQIRKILENKNCRLLTWCLSQPNLYKLETARKHINVPNQMLATEGIFDSIDVKCSLCYADGKLFSAIITSTKNWFPADYQNFCSSYLWKATIIYNKYGIYTINLYMYETDELKTYKRL